jgi:hypothetical protein
MTITSPRNQSLTKSPLEAKRHRNIVGEWPKSLSFMVWVFGMRIPGDSNWPVASALWEALFFYPITPATTMGELIDSWIAARIRRGSS